MIERIFLGWDAPLLPRAASFLVDRYGVGVRSELGGNGSASETGRRAGGGGSMGPLRIDGVLVVVPGRRAGRRLTELLLAGGGAAGGVLVPPPIITRRALPEALHPSPQPLAEEVVVRRGWVRALQAMDAGRLRALLSLPPGRDDLPAWWALAEEVHRLRCDLLGEGKDFRHVARLLEEEQVDDPERWHALAEAASEVDHWLGELGTVDRHRARLASARRAPGSTEGQDVCLVGLAELPGVTREMLGRLREPVVSLIHAPGSEDDAFRGDGTIRTAAWTGRALPVRDDQIRRADRPGDQADRVLEALEETGGRWGADEVVVGVGDEEVRPTVERALAGQDVPNRYAGGRPFRSTRPARLLATVADYLDGHSADDFAALLRHPDLGDWLHRQAGVGPDHRWLALLDRYRAERLPARLTPRTTVGGANPDLPQQVAAARDAVLGPGLLGPFLRRRPLPTWPEYILDLLLAVYGGLELDTSRPRDAALLRALEAVRDGLRAMARLPGEPEAEADAGAAIRVLLRELDREAVPTEPDPRAVELLGWLELAPDDAPAVIVTGMNEGRIPGSVQGDSFLPDALRSRLGLISNEDRYARDAFFLTGLIHSRPFVRLVSGLRSAAGDPLRPSRLLLATPGEKLPRRVLDFLEGETALDGAYGGADGPARTSEFRLPPDPEIRSAEPIEPLRVTDFRRLLDDPYRFALERVLGLESVDDTARELDAPGFGKLLHDVLERFGESELVHATRPDAIRAFLDRELDRIAAARFGSAPLPAVRVQIEQARARLSAFAAAQAARRREGWRIVRVEARSPEEGALLPTKGEPFRIVGRIDRIDHDPERGRWALLDYKTGERALSPEKSHRRGRKGEKRWVDLQLPLYRHLLSSLETPVPLPVRAAEAGPGVLQLGFFLLPRDPEETGVSTAEWDLDVLRSADRIALELIELVRRGRFRHDPEHLDARSDPFLSLRGGDLLGGSPADEPGSEGEG